MSAFLNWMEAQDLLQKGIALEYRDGSPSGRFNGHDWSPVDGPVTEHMSDFEFRLKGPEHAAIAQLQSSIGDYCDLLRSAHAIALRKGADTDWERFARRIASFGIGSVTAKVFHTRELIERQSQSAAEASSADNDFDYLERLKLNAVRYAHVRALFTFPDEIHEAMVEAIGDDQQNAPEDVDRVVDAQMAWLREHHPELVP